MASQLSNRAVAKKMIISSALRAIFFKMLTVPQILVNSKIVVRWAPI